MCVLYKMYKSLYRILMNFALQDFPSDHLQVVVRALYFAIQSCPREPCQGDPGSTLGDLGSRAWQKRSQLHDRTKQVDSMVVSHIWNIWTRPHHAI